LVRAALGLNCQVLLDSCFWSEFTFLENVLDVKADVLLGRLEKLGHSGLRQPNGLPIKSYLKAQRPVVVNQHLARRDRLRIGWHEFIAHDALAPISTHSAQSNA
jgi:hypothetical protein